MVDKWPKLATPQEYSIYFLSLIDQSNISINISINTNLNFKINANINTNTVISEIEGGKEKITFRPELATLQEYSIHIAQIEKKCGTQAGRQSGRKLRPKSSHSISWMASIALIHVSCC